MGRNKRGLGFFVLAAAALAVVGGGGGADAADSCAIATIRWDGGANTSAWGTPANWSPERVPEATDHVCIDSTAPGASVAFTTGTVTVKSLDVRKPFAVSGGTLTLGDAVQPSRLVGGVTLSGGTLGGASPRVLDGTLTWTGGTIAGPGTTTVPALKTLSMSGAGWKELMGPLRNDGTINLSGTGAFFFSANATLTNAKTFNIDSDALFDQFSSDSRILNLAGGTILKRNGVATVIEPPLENDGVLRSDKGEIKLSGGTPASTASKGAYTGGPGAAVVLNGGTTALETGATIVGAGGTVVDGTILTGPFTVVDNALLRFRSGTLRAPVGGTSTIAALGTMAVEGTAFKGLEHGLKNLGTLRVNATLSLGTGAVITNSGQLPVVAGGSIDCCTAGSGQMLVNTSTGVIDHTGDGASVGTIDVPVDNDGVVRSTGGRLDLWRGTGSAVSVGSYQSLTGATLGFAGGTHTFGPAGSVSGAGRIELDGATLSGVWQLLGGSTLTFEAGHLEGPKDATYARVLANAVIDVPTTATKWISGAVRNDGTIRINGFLEAADRLTLTNNNTVDIIGPSEFSCCVGAAPHVVVVSRNGKVIKTGTTDSRGHVEVPVANAGTVRSDSGTLSLVGGTGAGRNAIGAYTAVPGAGLDLNGGTYVFGAGGRIGPGLVTLDGGFLQGPFTVKAGGRLRHIEGGLLAPTDATTALFEPSSRWDVETTQIKDISGNIRHQGVAWIQGRLIFTNLAQVTNTGTIELDGSPVLAVGSGTNRFLVNEGTGLIRKRGVAGSTAYIDVPLDNDARVQATIGTLELKGGTPEGRESVGEYNGASIQGSLVFAAGTHVFGPGGRITGPAPVVARGGNVTGQFAVKAGGHLLQTTGEVFGPQSGDPGRIEPNGLWTIKGTSFKVITGQLRNEGTLLIDGWIRSAGNLVLTNAGAIEMAGAAWFGVWSGPAPHQMVNESTGTLRKTGVATSIGVVDISLDNDGVARAEGGTLSLQGGTGTARESTGVYTAVAGGPATVFNGGGHVFGAGGRLTGPGRTAVVAGSLGGPFTIATGARFAHAGGDINAPAPGDPPAVIETGGVLTVETTSFKILRGALTNAGTIVYAGDQRMDGAVAVLNDGLIQFPTTQFVNIWGGSGPVLFHNRTGGTFVKNGLTSTVSSLDVPVENDGVIRADSGTLALTNGSGSGRSGGVYRAVAAPSTAVRFGGGTHLVDTARIEGPGAATLTGGAVTGPLTVAAGGNLVWRGGDLNAPVDGTGEILVEAGATLRTESTSFKVQRGIVRNHGLMHVSGTFHTGLAGQLFNHSLTELSGTGLVKCCWDSGTVLRRFVNVSTGTVRTLNGTTRIEPTFQNLGTVVVHGGELFIDRPADVSTTNLGGGTWHTKGRLGFGVTDGFVTNTTVLVLEGPQAAVVRWDGLDALAGLKSNSGSITIINRSLTAANNPPVGTNAGDTFTNTGTLKLGPGGGLTTNRFRQNAGQVDLDATSTLTPTNGYVLAGGLLSGAGKVSGPLSSLGGSPPVRLRPNAEMDVTGDFSQSTNGVLEVELTGAADGVTQRQLLGTSAAVLGGKLDVDLADSFTPVAGKRYVLGTFANVSGAFATVDIEAPPTGFVLVPFYTATEFGVEVKAA